MTEVGPEWRKIMSPSLPSPPNLIVPTFSGDLMRRRLPLQRQLYRRPYASQLADNADSLLVVDVNCEGEIDGLNTAYDEVFERCRERLPVHILSLTGGNKLSLTQLIQTVPEPLCKSVHTLHIAQGPDPVYSPTSEGLHFIWAIPPSCFPEVTTLIVDGQVYVDLIKLAILFPKLTSLQVSQAQYIIAWDRLDDNTCLRDLSIRFLFGNQIFHDNIVTFTQLKRLRIVYDQGSLGEEVTEGIYTLTRLCSLCLDVSHTETECEEVLDKIAEHNTALQALHLPRLESRIAVPSRMDGLQQLIVPIDAVIPHTSRVTQLAMRRNPEDLDARAFPSVAPKNLLEGSISYEQILTFINCDHLQVLLLKPHSASFTREQHVHMMGVMERIRNRNGKVWPHLHTLIILPEQYEVKTLVAQGRVGFERDGEYLTDLIGALGRSVRPLRHVTLFMRASKDSVQAVDMLFHLTSLSSVTLVKVDVTVSQLRRLVNLPHMGIIELIAVEGLLMHEVKEVRKEIGVRPIRILMRQDMKVFKEQLWTPSQIYWR